jgi:hypothetical protein
MHHVAPGGRFVFIYNTRLDNQPSVTWRYHSLDDAREHFSAYREPRFFFVIKRLLPLLGRRAFHPAYTRLSSTISRRLGIGGDIVCIVTKD